MDAGNAGGTEPASADGSAAENPHAEASSATAQPPALWFGGDVHLGERGSSDLSAIVAMMGGAPGVVNLEGPIGEVGSARNDAGRILLANPPDTAARLQAAGIVAASIANNHARDAGEGGLARTTAALAATDIVALGQAEMEVGGQRARLLAHEVGEASLKSAFSSEFAAFDGVAVVLLHTSGPPSYLPGPAAEAAADAALGAGADIVVLSGSHRVARVERRGKAVIAWGLGNLVFDCPCTAEAEALVLKVELTADLPARILPIRAGLDGAPAALAPDPDGIFDLLEGLGATRLRREGATASF
jgi:poly-gamma-glutamate capsule biosynthesis protein CapA/YwtB (metallophosphatase superfamily)